MIEHVWTVVCSRAVIDRHTNNVSLEGVIEQLNVTIKEEMPEPTEILPISLEIMTLWARSDFDAPIKGRERVAVVSPSGVVNGPFETNIDLSSAKRLRTRGKFDGLLAEPGRHTFRVEFQNEGEIEWRQVAAVPIEVIFVSPEEAEQTETAQ